MKKMGKRIMSAALAVVLCVSTVNIPAYAWEKTEADEQEVVIENSVEDDIVTGETETNVPDKSSDDASVAWDQKTTEKVYEGKDYKVVFKLSSYWETGYNADIIIENTGNDVIHDWYLKFDYADDITNIWNAVIDSNNVGSYIIKNAVWNQDIAACDSVEFGISGSQAFNEFPQNVSLTGTCKEVKNEDYSIDYHVDSDWGSGFTGSIQITNNTEEVLEDWVLEFDFDREITNIWDGVIESHEGNHYVVRNASYNANILSHATCSFGFEGMNGVKEDNPENIKLRSYSLYGGDSMEIDTDGDGVVDGIEKLMGWDYQSSDTDGDGLSDYYEYSICNTNPLIVDTDGDGLSDDMDDEDGDGLINISEFQNNTNPLVCDTDQDGLDDYQEATIYKSDPLKKDTDGDELSDYDDVKLGFSPLLKDTDGNGIIDSEEIVKQTFEQKIADSEKDAVTNVSVTMSICGNIENSIAICNLNNIDVMSSNVVGLIGVPVEITCNTIFEDAIITFWYDKEKLGDTYENDLAIMWYDEGNGCYTLLEDSYVDTRRCSVSYKTTHFSTYMLVDKSEWYSSWKKNLDYRSVASADGTYYDFAFVIDVSGSMSGTRISVAKQALNGFIDILDDKDSACIVKFNSYATVISGFTHDKENLHTASNSLYASGGTNVNNGLIKALDEFGKIDNTQNDKVIILLCDGDVNYDSNTINSCINNNISIFTVNVGSASGSNYLKMMSDKTGGEYYYCPTSGSIETVFGLIRNDTINEVDTTDTDRDGLYDVYEIAGMRLPNGQIVCTDPNKADTDGDGLTDYEETGIVYSGKLNIGTSFEREYKYVLMASNPLRIDTDFDGKLDPEDEKPWEYDTVDNLLLYQYKRYKGKNEDGSIAHDLLYNDYSKERILNINDLFEYQFIGQNPNPENLFYDMKLMSTLLFSTGKLQDVIVDMISHFKDGTGSDYKNEILTQKSYEHESTQKYINDVKNHIISRLKNNGGNIYALEFREETKTDGQSIYNWVESNTERPKFHNISDIIGGLTICVNDTWGNTVEVTDYNFDGEHFSGNLHFCVYDHFGLDQPDVEKKYVDLAGFRSWFVLQHYDGFNGAYVPFVTLMEYDIPFEGDIYMYKPAK